MIIKEKLIEKYPLTEKAESEYECYKVAPRKYVIFLDDTISHSDTEALLDKLATSTKTSSFVVNLLIVVGNTNEKFKPEDLVFFNGEDTFIVYYLLNSENGKIYFNDQRMYLFSAGWRKIIKRFNEILE